MATKTPVDKIPARAMLDLEDLDGGLRAAYATMIDALPAPAGGVLLVANYEGEVVTLEVAAGVLVTVVTYGVSNMLETAT